MLASSVVLEQEINSAAIASEMKQVVFFILSSVIQNAGGWMLIIRK